MKRSLILQPRAFLDIQSQTSYLQAASESLGRRFYQAVLNTFDQILEMSESGNPYLTSDPRLQRIRYWRISRFPNHVIYYRVGDDKVEIIRLLHAAQDADANLQS